MEALSFIDPAELTEFARLARADFDAQSQSLARFLPYVEIDDIRFAYNRGADALVDEATFRAYDAESPIGRRPGSARITGEIPAISRKIPLSEYAQLRTRALDVQEAAIISGVYRDAERLARGIAARLERARGELFQTGKVTLNENGVVSTYDSGRASSLTITTTPSNGYWSVHNTSTPVTDLIGWADTVAAANEAGIRPNRVLVSTTIMGHLQQCDEVRGFTTAVANAPARVTTGAVQDAILGLTGMTLDVYETPAGMATSPMASNVVVLLRDNVALGSTAYGVPLEASEPEYAQVAPQPGVYAGSWKTKDPINVWSHAVGLALPLLAAPDLTLAAKVLP